jgi:glycosyltransferase involved in cell wall biosynthesis
MTTYSFLSTYPPTQCGLATFSAALLKHLAPNGSGHRGGVVRIVDALPPTHAPGVVAHLVNDTPQGTSIAAAALNQFDVAVIQHEYGIYGGRDGEDVLRVLAELTVPAVVVFHTVLITPSPHQRQLLERIADAADGVVVMSQVAADRLADGYLVDAAKISVIPHGALPNRRSTVSDSFDPLTSFGSLTSRTPVTSIATGSSLSAFAPTARTRKRPTVLTWGLIGPGKGIEWAIDAFADLRDLHPAPRYLVAGQTHPKVLEREGEAYRNFLRSRAEAHGVSANVEFDAGYRDVETLMALVRQADVVLLPYDATEQATSGVLIEAVAACRPVVATKFPHATEMLATGAGLLVSQKDAPAMSQALRRILTEPGLAASMTAASGRIAPSLEWSAVADVYHDLAESLLGVRTGLRSEVAA